LAHNDWMISKALYKVLLYNEPNTKITIEQFKKLKIIGIPWQDYRQDYSHLIIQGEWWKLVESAFEEAYKLLCIDAHRANKYAKQAHHELAKPDEFKLYDDTVEILSYFKLNGWKNVILSNHIPELPDIVHSLGLKKYIYKCISSANTGFEKPNQKIYEFALEQVESPQKAWMVGDSLLADVKGPEKVGITGVLVRTQKVEKIEYYSKNLLGLKNIIY
jgi:putative hydrolase of the HAD superfamily